jgi:uncharacterized membrane protein YdbT with pleckstrin-like domain
MEAIQYVWKDRKRILGMPITFTRYRLSEDRIFCEKGFLNIKQEEVLLYRVRDLELRMSLGQRLFGVGTICVHSSDKTLPHLDLLNIKNPREIKEMIHQRVESAKDQRRMKTMEIMGQNGSDMDVCDDELLDDQELDH